jgi:hypothetical protein
MKKTARIDERRVTRDRQRVIALILYWRAQPSVQK